MQQSIYRIPLALLLALLTQAAFAQKPDTVKPLPKKIPLVMEGNKAINKEHYIVLDSADIAEGRLHVENGKLYLLQSDSLYRINDSLFKRNKALKARNDTLFLKNKALFNNAKRTKFRSDSIYKVQQHTFRKSEKLFRKSDSIYKVQQKFFTKPELTYRQTRKLDSLKRLNWKKDSVRIKKDINALKSDLQRLKNDSLRSIRGRHKKLVTREIDCSQNTELLIENIGRKLTIKTGSGNKIKLETVAFVENGSDEKEADWSKTFNITVTGNKTRLVIKKAVMPSNTGGVAPSPEPNAYKVDFKSPLTIYVPASVKIKIEHRYNELIIADNIDAIELDLLNTALKMKDAQKAGIKSRYGSVKAGSIGIAALELVNCSFSSLDLQTASIDSRYSHIKLNNVDKLTMKSVSDEYTITRVKDISGSKSFGQMNITELGNSFTLSGSSADVQIQSIDNSVKTINLVNKYADIKFPVQKLQNYTVQFDGTRSKVFTPFEKIMASSADSSGSSNPSFTKTVGDIKKDFTAFVVNCSSCSVDFR